MGFSKNDAPRVSPVGALVALIKREVVVELRTKSLLTSMGLFSILCIVVLGLGVKSLVRDDTYHRFVLAVLWVCTLFASVVGLNRAAVADRRNGFFSALMMMPVDPAWVYCVRLASSFMFLLISQGVMIGVSVPMLKLGFFDQPWMIAVIVLADLGVLAPGVLLASTTSQVRGGEALLTVMLFPVVVPVFLGATGATNVLEGGLGFAELQPWLILLTICVALFAALGMLLYGRLNEA